MPCCGLISSEQPIGHGASTDLQLSWGYSLTLGGRWYMEDYHTAEVKETPSGKPAGCFAIYDGHGGRQCVQFVQKRLYKTILAHRAFATGDITTAMYQGYMQIDEKFSQKRGRATCGTTSTTAIVYDNTLYIAHCGDSRAVVIKSDGVEPLTRDHKPADPTEAARIEGRGGTIVDDDVPRVCGVLAVTRAFGNNSIKATVNAEPEVSKHSITDDFEYIVIASDGVWDVLSNEDVAELIRRAENVRMAAEDITLEAYRLGSSDNISAVVVALNYSGPVPLTSSLANAVRNFSNRGVRPGSSATGGSPGALTTTFDTGLRGGGRVDGTTSSTNGAVDAGKVAATSPFSGRRELEPSPFFPQSAAGVLSRTHVQGASRASDAHPASAAPSGDPASTQRTPPHSPLSDAVGYSVSPPAHERTAGHSRDPHSALHDAKNAHVHPDRLYEHSYAHDPASQDRMFAGVQGAGYHPDSMQGGAMDQYEYGYEDDGVIFEGHTPTYAAANSPDAEARYWDRFQNLPPEQDGFGDHGYDGMGYGEYGQGDWGYGDYGIGRWGHLEDIAEEGESGLSSSQHMAGSSGSFHYSKHANSNSIEQRQQWGRGDRNGSLQRVQSPSPRNATSPSPQHRPSPRRAASPPIRDPSLPANGMRGVDPGSGLAAEAPAIVEPQGAPPTKSELAALRSSDAGQSPDADQAAYHSADQDLDMAEYDALQAHAHQYNSDVMGEHTYEPPSKVDMLHSNSSGEHRSADGGSNYVNASAGGSKPKSGSRTAPVRRPSGGAAAMDHALEGARSYNAKLSASGGSSIMSQKSSASQPVSARSSRSDTSLHTAAPPATKGRRSSNGARSGTGSPPRRSSAKQPAKRPPFKF